MNYDYLQAIFWSLAYILIIVYNIRYKTLGIPVISISSNFAWETVALINDIKSNSFDLIHVIWIALDILIVITYFVFCEPLYTKHKFPLLLLYLIEVIVFLIVFGRNNGMLLSSFVIDLTMAIEYVIYSLNKKLKFNYVLFAIFVTKLFGDLCAWLYYKAFDNQVLLIGIIVLLLNSTSTAIVALRIRKHFQNDE